MQSEKKSRYMKWHKKNSPKNPKNKQKMEIKFYFPF